jgi:hypothetical protein
MLPSGDFTGSDILTVIQEPLNVWFLFRIYSLIVALFFKVSSPKLKIIEKGVFGLTDILCAFENGRSSSISFTYGMFPSIVGEIEKGRF